MRIFGICKLFFGCHLGISNQSFLNQSYINPSIMDNLNPEIIDDTQPQTQSQTTGQGIWDEVNSQPIKEVLWGRLYPQNSKLSSMDLCSDTFAAGRAENNNLMFTVNEMNEDTLQRVSKVHFIISKDLKDITGPVYIEDKSRNGTFVNGIRIDKKMILNDNDTIALVCTQNRIFKYKGLGPNEADGLPEIITKKYHVGKKLGQGACGIVRLVYDRCSCKPFAMKHIQINQLTSVNAAPKNIMNEVSIMQQLKHPCIIQMHNIIDNGNSLFIFLENMNGGDLLSRIISKAKLSENISKLYFLQMVCAVKHLHDQQITHRDLKPDNILLESTDDETRIRISDFGLSKLVGNESVMRTLCGTPLYVAPEVLKTNGLGTYTRKVDIWSLGVVLFTCLSGTLPFSDEYGSPASEQIKRGKFAFKSHAWKSVSHKAKNIIHRMLTVNPEQRPGIDEVLHDRWLNDADVITKAEQIMNITVPLSQEENQDVDFAPPASKRRRIETTHRERQIV